MLSQDTTKMFSTKLFCSFATLVNIFILAVALLLFSLVAGCKTLEQGARTTSPTIGQLEYQVVEGGGWLSVFFNLKEPHAQHLTFELVSVEVKSAQGWKTLSNTSVKINSKQLGTGQLLIARNMVETEVYYNLRFTLLDPKIKREGRDEGLPMSVPIVEMEFPAGLNFKNGDSHSIFVTWDVENSITGKESFEPVMKTTLQAIPLLSDLLFLACPEIDTIYVLRTDKNWVISSLGIPGEPTFIEVDDSINVSRLYVLTPKKSIINVVDLTTFKVIDKIFLSLDFEPSFMTFSPDKQFAYVLDNRGRNIAKINVHTGTQESRASVSFNPQYAVFLEDQNLLAVSASDINNVYFLNSENLIPVNVFSVGSNPNGLLSWTNFIFVAEGGSNTVSAYDLVDGSQRNRVNVGFVPARLFLKEDQLYVTNLRSRSVTVMLPGQLNVLDEIVIRGTPGEIIGSESRRWLYVGDTQNGGLAVIEPTTNRLSRFIGLQTMPLGMAVLN
jgi:DNA-binding beta-propeller fold protein YncE